SAIQSLYAARDTTAPLPAPLTLTVQAAPAQVTTSSIALSGTAVGGQGGIRVTWTTDRGGLGSAQGSSSWAVSAVPLGVGRNTISVRAEDDASTVVMQSIVVERVDNTPPPPPPPASPQAPTIQITSPAAGYLTTTSLTADIRG